MCVMMDRRARLNSHCQTAPSRQTAGTALQATAPSTNLDTTLLFHADDELLRTTGASMADAVIKVGEETVTLLMSNFGSEPLQLESGARIEHLQPVEIVDDCFGESEPVGKADEAHDAATNNPVGNVAAICNTLDERTSRLLSTLCIEEMNFEEDGQKEELICLIVEFAHSFALDQTEPGQTTVVAHKIDTNNHPPIRQQP